MEKEKKKSDETKDETKDEKQDEGQETPAGDPEKQADDAPADGAEAAQKDVVAEIRERYERALADQKAEFERAIRERDETIKSILFADDDGDPEDPVIARIRETRGSIKNW